MTVKKIKQPKILSLPLKGDEAIVSIIERGGGVLIATNHGSVFALDFLPDGSRVLTRLLDYVGHTQRLINCTR